MCCLDVTIITVLILTQHSPTLHSLQINKIKVKFNSLTVGQFVNYHWNDYKFVRHFKVTHLSHANIYSYFIAKYYLFNIQMHIEISNELLLFTDSLTSSA